jgi:hypothetical protein
MVKDMAPNDVAALFQDVFEQLPGVDMTRADPGAEEEPIPTSYQPGGELGDRPAVGFQEQLMEMIRQELTDHRGMRESKYSRKDLIKWILDPDMEHVDAMGRSREYTADELQTMSDNELDAIMHAGIPEGP